MDADLSLSRRQLLGLAAGAAAGAVGTGVGLRSAGAAPPRRLAGTPFALVALDGKAALGQVYDHPPNYETPTTRLIGRRNAPFTDAEDYYVRYREADVYRVDPASFGCASAARQRPSSWTCRLMTCARSRSGE